MTKVKNIHSFPEKKELVEVTCFPDMRVNEINRAVENFNQAREIIGELDITFDIGKVYRNLGSNGVDDKDLATALSKGDILR